MEYVIKTKYSIGDKVIARKGREFTILAVNISIRRYMDGLDPYYKDRNEIEYICSPTMDLSDSVIVPEHTIESLF